MAFKTISDFYEDALFGKGIWVNQTHLE
jgi:hypothetical protein